ncbi:hypothetical protein EDB89DRAFT_1901100 [Lactarius sanguifluus]|nr:hypothetical protein EDB89DRAFT_1901100 [Lactarius sanguifluus]
MYSTSTRAGASSLATKDLQKLEGVRVSLPGWGSGTRKKGRLDPYGYGHADRDAGAAVHVHSPVLLLLVASWHAGVGACDMTRTHGASSTESGRKAPTGGAVWMLLGASEPPISCRTPVQVVLEGNLEESQRSSDKRVPNHVSSLSSSLSGKRKYDSLVATRRSPPQFCASRSSASFCPIKGRQTKRQCALSPSQKGPTQLHKLGAGVDLNPPLHWIPHSGTPGQPWREAKYKAKPKGKNNMSNLTQAFALFLVLSWGLPVAECCPATRTRRVFPLRSPNTSPPTWIFSYYVQPRNSEPRIRLAKPSSAPLPPRRLTSPAPEMHACPLSRRAHSIELLEWGEGGVKHGQRFWWEDLECLKRAVAGRGTHQSLAVGEHVRTKRTERGKQKLPVISANVCILPPFDVDFCAARALAVYHITPGTEEAGDCQSSV